MVSDVLFCLHMQQIRNANYNEDTASHSYGSDELSASTMQFQKQWYFWISDG